MRWKWTENAIGEGEREIRKFKRVIHGEILAEHWSKLKWWKNGSLNEGNTSSSDQGDGMDRELEVEVEIPKMTDIHSPYLGAEMGKKGISIM